MVTWLYAHLLACGRMRGVRLGLRWGRRSCSLDEGVDGDDGGILLPWGGGGRALWLGQELNILTTPRLPLGYFL